MNRSNLRSLPTLATLPAPAAVRAEAELAALFDGFLERGLSDEESPDFELLEAAVDGTLDPIEAERFASRLVGDPVLQREFDGMVALRDQLRLSPTVGGTVLRPATRTAERRWLGFAAAAVLLAAIGLGLHQEAPRTDSASASATSASPEATPSQPDVVFADSFEGGNTDLWSN